MFNETQTKAVCNWLQGEVHVKLVAKYGEYTQMGAELRMNELYIR